MNLNLRRWRGVTLWLAIGAVIAPLGFNCHSSTDQSAAISKNDARPDDEDQTVRALASISTNQPDGAPASEEKVRLSSSDIAISADKARAMGLSAKISSANDQVIPKGTSLLALYDNECRGKQGLLRFEAEEIKTADDTAVSELSAQAASDPCLIRVDENKVRQLVAPVPDEQTAAFRSQEASALATTTNDARLAEARHISFSKALLSWDWFFSGSGIKNDVVVAVVDTGVLYTHPDLADNAYSDSAGNHGYDFINNDNDPIDDNGHGTHVSGIIGARANNGIGVTGVIGTKVKIMGVKVLNAQGSGADTAIVNGIRYAADQGAQVINMSLGGRFTSAAIRDAMIYAVGKGVVVIVAAGNDSTLINAGGNFYAPAGYAKDLPGSLAVASVDAVNGTLSGFSNYSTTYVWIAAPGSNGILSTYTGNSYTALQGTSMASPVVAGAAALLVGAFRAHSIAYTPANVTTILTESSRAVAGLGNSVRGGASLDIERAAKLFYSRYVMAGNGGTEVQ